MVSKAGGKGPAKIPKKMKREPEPDDNDDDNFLEDLVTTTETDKGQPSYSTLETGGFMTKGGKGKRDWTKDTQNLQQRQENQTKGR